VGRAACDRGSIACRSGATQRGAQPGRTKAGRHCDSGWRAHSAAVNKSRSFSGPRVM